MGGFGSGRRSNKATTDDCLHIRLPDLKRLGMLKRHCLNRRTLSWNHAARTVAQFTLVADVDCREPFPSLRITGHTGGRRVDCLVWLESQQMHFGGERWYALCPHTGKRCTTLVLPPVKTHFASVGGWNVAYGSQRECEMHRAHRAVDKASSRLKALSKYARKPTRERLMIKWVAKLMSVEDELDRFSRSIN